MFHNDKDLAITVYNLDLVNGGYHWLFLIFDKIKRTLYILDPLKVNVDRSVKTKLLEWFNQTGRGNPARNNPNDWNFTERWTVKTIPHSRQTDGTSCGLYCAEYALDILKNFPVLPQRIDVKPDMSELRMKHTATFLKSATEEL